MEKLIIFENDQYIEYPLVDELLFEQFKVKLIDNEVLLEDANQEILLKVGEKVAHKQFAFLVLPKVYKSYWKETNTILIGQNNCQIDLGLDEHIAIDADILINEDQFPIFINGMEHRETKVAYQLGDHILIDTSLFIVHETYLKIFSNHAYMIDLKEKEVQETYFDSFPDYKRSPRLIKRINSDKIVMLKPTAQESRKKGGLVKVIVPPLAMLGVSAASAILMGRGLFVLVTIAGTLVTLIFSITTFFSEKKELKEKNRKRKEIYEQYLLKVRKDLHTFKENEIEALAYNNPNIHEIEEMVNTFSPRIYERDVNDDDFLNVCVGHAKDTCDFKVTLDYDALSMEKDPLLEEAKQIWSDYQYIDHKPITVDLKKAHIGIVGEKKDVHQQIQNMLAQITFFQSYHSVEIIMLYNEKYATKFDYLKWYPHAKLHSVNLTGNIHSERVRDQVLGSLHQILKDRKIKRDENKREMAYLPHYIIVVDDYHLIMNHAIMEYLQEASADLGFTLVYTAQKRANLPENIKTVVMMEDASTATLLLNEGKEANMKLTEVPFDDINLEKMARNLKSINHLQGVSAHIPESITYFDMYKVSSPEELNIKQRWDKGESHKSLAVPLGVRAEDDYVELNLHEKAHGPHGLVAGTTGSGKSEIIQSYILSLATNFSPYEVGFLLIDYKGGGMANLFKNMPHLLGTITNLDGAESMRALASIKAELSRRQRIFNEYSVNNINKYNKLFKSGKAKEPLPHLFIISDEFAELKKEQPDFMSELVSVARIGRTLGVHLILATQKPTGVVDDQIWSNSKFKLALKVQNEADSKEIIKTSDASFITLPGRAYLQVGNNEIYELFQSAWSGATYTGKEKVDRVDDRIYKINLLGQSELINKDLSSDDSGSDSMYSQLDAVIDHIHDVYDAMNHVEVTKPWLPTLKDKIVSPYIKEEEIEDLSLIKNIDLDISVGIVDIPELQTQEDYHVNFVEDGNLAIFASSGFGKSVTLGTIITSLATKNNPELLNFYILDLGNSSLIPYKNLPHTADYMNFDSDEKINKFRSIIQKEMKERKKLFGQAMAQNFDMYNKMNSDNKMKAIFIIIDNFDVVREISMEFDEFVTKATRDGAGLGIYTVVSATRANAIRFATLNNFKKKIVQYLFDDGDVMSLVGRSQYKLTEKKGRALIKQKLISTMQVYTSVTFEDDVEYMENSKSLIHRMKERYTGNVVRGIPVLPDIFTTKDYDKYAIADNTKDLVGLSLEGVDLVSANITDAPYVILGPVKSGKTNFLEILMNQDDGTKYVFDASSLDLFTYKSNKEIKYVETEDDRNEFMSDVLTEITNRKQGLDAAIKAGDVQSPKVYYRMLPNWSIYIDDIDLFIENVKAYPNIVSTLQDAAGTGIRIIVTAYSTKLKGYDDLTKFFKASTYGAVLGNQGTVNMFALPSIRDVPTFGYGVLCNNGVIQKVKLPKYMGF